MAESEVAARSGYVALIGRPNVGKSTLLNRLVGEKLSIVSQRPHTTRQRVLGVLNHGVSQAVFIDTPGHTRQAKRALQRVMIRTYQQAVDDADLVLLLVDARRISNEDQQLIEFLARSSKPALLVLNKIDLLDSRESLLPRLESLKELPFRAFVPVSAERGDNLKSLVDAIVENLPAGTALFPLDYKTDKDLRFRSAETVREKLFESLREEIPYGLTVEIEVLDRQEDGRWLVHALIWVERESHKPIVIGKSGQLLKTIGRRARLDLMELLGGRVHLEMWVKVREHWSDSERELKRLGFE
jgi:GTP-binding protein Era